MPEFLVSLVTYAMVPLSIFAALLGWSRFMLLREWNRARMARFTGHPFLARRTDDGRPAVYRSAWADDSRWVWTWV